MQLLYPKANLGVGIDPKRDAERPQQRQEDDDGGRAPGLGAGVALGGGAGRVVPGLTDPAVGAGASWS